jgi:glycosyltransferase involved in cell wall biosynthesis
MRSLLDPVAAQTTEVAAETKRGARQRIAVISSGLGHVNRGVETWMLDLASALQNAPLDVELWSGAALSQASRPYKSLHVLRRESRFVRGASWHRRYLWEQLSALPAAISRAALGNFDLIYCGDPVLSWHLKRFQRLHGAKVVFMNGMRLSPQWASAFDAIHVLAPEYLEEARQQVRPAADKFFAVPHFVETERFHAASAAEKRSLRDRFGLPQDAFLVLTVGPIGRVSGKRTEHLAREIARAQSNITLVSAGVTEDGSDEVLRECSAALGKQFRFLGSVPRSGMPDLFRVADAYSLASLAEPFSIAILEALSSGLPVVHHRDTVMSWVAGDGGIPVSMETVGDAARAFTALAKNEILRSSFSQRARKLAESRYAMKPIAAQIASAFQRICCE